MAMIKCPECGKEISEYATNCSNCGFPLDLLNKVKNENDVSNDNAEEINNVTIQRSEKVEKGKRTEAHRRADKVYAERHQPIFIGISYKTDKEEGERLKAFLKETNDNANHYIKTLIKKDLDARNFHI